MSITIIVAMARNGAIGLNNRLPWYIPEDLKHFRDTTMGKTLVMGRNTFESILKSNKGNPLVGRKHIVLSRCDPSKEYRGMDGVMFVKDFRDILKASLDQNIYVIGGSSVYSIFGEYADELIITYIDRVYSADSFFPDIDWDSFKTKKHTHLTDYMSIYHATRKHRLDEYFFNRSIYG